MLEIEELRRRLEVEELVEGADGATVQTNQRSGRKSHRGEEFVLSIIHFKNGFICVLSL